jgi:hypothetical protein
MVVYAGSVNGRVNSRNVRTARPKGKVENDSGSLSMSMQVRRPSVADLDYVPNLDGDRVFIYETYPVEQGDLVLSATRFENVPTGEFTHLHPDTVVYTVGGLGEPQHFLDVRAAKQTLTARTRMADPHKAVPTRRALAI